MGFASASTGVGCLRAPRSGPPTARGARYPEPAPDHGPRLRLGQSGRGIGDPTSELVNGLSTPRMNLHHPGIILQTREFNLLAALGRFRLLTSEHLLHLVYPGVSVRFVNRRLALLARHGFIDRHRLPDFDGPLVVLSRRPVYSLARRGAELVGDGLWPGVRFVPSAWAVTRHSLVASDLLVATLVAGRLLGLAASAQTEPELRARLRAAQKVGSQFPGAVLPDAALSLATLGRTPEGFCIEVVRAGVKGGNRTLLRKMEKYVELNRAGFFRQVYGIERLRAVVLVTTSPARAGGLVRWASGLAHGRRLFLATSYERKADFAMTFDPKTVLRLPLLDCEGEASSFIHT